MDIVVKVPDKFKQICFTRIVDGVIDYLVDQEYDYTDDVFELRELTELVDSELRTQTIRGGV